MNSTPSNPIIIGTAGHIDHGKSALVKALTGTDPDRLPEEQARGITIDLGFAFLSEHVAFIDVPGHEKFIKNMAAGAATVDHVLLVIAADDGVMPQTREHLAILELLGLERGFVVLTKADLVDADWIALVKEDIATLLQGTFLENAPFFVADSLSGRGIEELKRAIFDLSRTEKPRRDPGFFRLNVDRSFIVKGYGTVVTGSILSGRVRKDDLLEVMPKGLEVRVRGVEVHGKGVASASAGQRAALNLASVSKDGAGRGDVLVTPGTLKPTDIIDAEIRVLGEAGEGVEHRQRMHLHIGTTEVLARVCTLDKHPIPARTKALAQLRLESPVAVLRGDRFILRSYSPMLTIAGGVVLDANPVMRRKPRPDVIQRLELLAQGKGEGAIQALLDEAEWISAGDVVKRFGIPAEEALHTLEELAASGRVVTSGEGERLYLSAGKAAAFVDSLKARLESFHRKEPLKRGVRKNEVPGWFKKELKEDSVRRLMGLSKEQGVVDFLPHDLVCLKSYQPSLSEAQSELSRKLDALILEAGCSPPTTEEAASKVSLDPSKVKPVLELLGDEARLVLIDGFWFHKNVLDQALRTIRTRIKDKGEITVSDFREVMATSRKYAVPLLAWFDTQKRTARKGEGRVAGALLEQDL